MFGTAGRLLATIFAVLTALLVGFGTRTIYPPPAPDLTQDKLIESHLYGLSVREIDVQATTDRGAIATFDDYLIVSSRDGDLFQILPGSPVEVSAMAFSVPLTLKSEELAKFDERTLSVLDIEVIERDGLSPRLYASYFDYSQDRRCLTVVLSSIGIGLNESSNGRLLTPHGEWTEDFRTSPCIDVDMLWPGSLFGGGGRIEQYGVDILLSVGSLGIDGTGDEPPVSQLPDYDYGKVLRISPDEALAFTVGHRNPQGLVVLTTGTVLQAEHGPRGGDEINLLRAGQNYGWPFVTYGTSYDSFAWEQNPENGRHAGYRKPLMSFVPSVGIGELVEVVENTEFPAWAGDVLAASLRDQTLFRLRYEGGRIIYAEPIRMRKRLRDIAILSDGRVALLTSTGQVLIVQNANSARPAD